MSTKNVTAPAVLPTFTATPELREAFQRALTDVTALSLVGKQVHWNVVGQGFRSIHLNLDVVVDIAREASDEIAERMRALNAVPDPPRWLTPAFRLLRPSSSSFPTPSTTPSRRSTRP